MIHRLLSLLFVLFVATTAIANTKVKSTKVVINGTTLYLPGNWQHAFDNPEHGQHAYRDTTAGLQLTIAVHDARIMKFYSDKLTNYQLAISAYENDIDHWVDIAEPKQKDEDTTGNYIIRGLNNPEENAVILYGAKDGKIIGLHLMKTSEGNMDMEYARGLLHKIFTVKK